MATTKLSDNSIGGVLGVGNGSISFVPRINSGFTVSLQFLTGASATATLLRSTDGQNFSPMLAGSRIVTTRKTSGAFRVFETSGDATWRLDYAVAAGAVGYYIGDGATIDRGDDMCFLNLPPSSYFGGAVNLSPSNAQTQQQYINKFSPLSDSDLAGDLTVYKTCLNNTFAKLNIPAAAQRTRGQYFMLGARRDIRAEYATVVSVFDGNGGALSNARSILDSSLTYTPGSQVTAADFYGRSTGAFTSATNTSGIYGYPTLLEAVAGYVTPAGPAPNLTALGL